MIQYKFFPQKGKKDQNTGKQGILSVVNKAAVFFSDKADKDSKVFGILEHPEIVFINAVGIMLKGYEPVGFDSAGREKFEYQEWYCSFVNEKG